MGPTIVRLNGVDMSNLARNKTYDGFVDHYSHIFVIDCPQEAVELLLKLSSHFFQGTNVLVVLDDCAASKDMKGRPGQLVSLGVSAHHAGNQRVGSHAADHQHRKAIPRKRGRHRSANWPNKASRTRRGRWPLRARPLTGATRLRLQAPQADASR